MKIVLMEPLGIEKDTLDRLAAGLTKEGHDFTAYDTFSTDAEKQRCGCTDDCKSSFAR